MAHAASASEEAPECSDEWPIFSSTGEEESCAVFTIWPFLSVEKTAEWRQVSLRPFYVGREASDGSEKKVHILWPLYLFKRAEEDITVRLAPLLTYKRDIYGYVNEREEESEGMLFPFVFWGESSEEDRYLAVFPLGGTLNNFLGRDRIRFVLFPLYHEYWRNELHQRNFLWPVLSFSEGGDYKGFRLWPLYGYLEKENDYRREFALWPVYHHGTFDLDKEQKGERTLVLPLYAREDSERRRVRSILWPFFTHEENYAGKFEEYSMPWPFITFTKGNDVNKKQFWPFYGYSRTSDAEKTFALWPFWRKNVIQLDGETERQETMLLPIVLSQTETSKSRGLLKRKFKIWPLYRSRQFEDGSKYVSMPSLLWFDDPEGFERQYAPLWTIYEHEAKADGTSYIYAFWRLFRHKVTADSSKTYIPLLFSHSENVAENSESTEILGGLLTIDKAETERRLRLFYFMKFQY